MAEMAERLVHRFMVQVEVVAVAVVDILAEFQRHLVPINHFQAVHHHSVEPAASVMALAAAVVAVLVGWPKFPQLPVELAHQAWQSSSFSTRTA